MDKRLPWYVILRRERNKNSWSQEELAEKIGSNAKTVSRWERGQTQMPGPFLRRQIAQILSMSIEELGLVLDQEEPEVEESEVSGLVQTVSTRVDWGEAPHMERFLGRERELDTITHWITNEDCRMATILGLGGVGKTTLGTMAAKRLQEKFEIVYWRSLQQAPTLARFLDHYLQFVFQVRRADLPKDRDEQFSLLLTSLREQKCLLILDNFESILSTERGMGRYQQGYEDYGHLLRLIGETDHASCLLMTSREKPTEVARMEGKYSTVHSIRLEGIEQSASQELLAALDLYGSDEAWANLVHVYAGNPLALKLVAEPIRKLFGGDITNFLQEKEIVFGDITTLIAEQFEPLGKPEKGIIYWLAIEREAISVQELRTRVLKTEIQRPLLEIVELLLRCSLLELHDGGRLTLQPVVMEYATGRLVEQIAEEISSEKVALLDSHTLMRAEAKDYVRLSQEQFILKAVAERLIATFGKGDLVKKLQRILSTAGSTEAEPSGYAAGNILNLLIHVHADLSGADFSSQTVRQAYLQGVNLIDVNFVQANLATSVFTDTFSCILCIALSANSKLLAAGTTTGEVRLWQAKTLTPLFTCVGHVDGVRSVAFSPDGQLLISGSEDGTVRIWDTITGQCLRVLCGHTDQIYAVTFSPDGWSIASGSEDKTVRIWDATTGSPLALLKGHAGRVRSLAFSITGNVLASGSEDATIHLWDRRTGNSTGILYGHRAAVRAVAYSPRGNVLASGGQDQTIRLWDMDSGMCSKILEGHTDLVRAITFSSDGKLLASSSDDQTISLWDVESGTIVKVLHPQSTRIWSLAFFPNSTTLVSANESASEDDMLHFWDIRQGQCIRQVRGYCSLIKSVVFGPDGKLLISGSEENDLRVWDAASGHCLTALYEHSNRIRSVTVSPDGRTAASGSEDETICIWDIQAKLCRQVLRGHSHLVRSVAFSPDGTMLASGSHDQTVRLWDGMTGQCLRVLQGPGNPIWCVAFSPDGSVLASGNDDYRVYLWNVTTGAIVNVLRGHTSRVWSVAFSSDGRTLASASDDGTLRTWDSGSGRCLLIFKGHERWVRSVAFSPNGNLLASGSHDHTVRVWDAHSGQCLQTLQGHSSCVWSVTFSPDGQTIASCGDDGTIRLWDAVSWNCLNILRSDRPYERMNISRTKGLTDAQKAALITLGAVEGK